MCFGRLDFTNKCQGEMGKLQKLGESKSYLEISTKFETKVEHVLVLPSIFVLPTIRFSRRIITLNLSKKKKHYWWEIECSSQWRNFKTLSFPLRISLFRVPSIVPTINKRKDYALIYQSISLRKIGFQTLLKDGLAEEVQWNGLLSGTFLVHLV